MTKKENTNIVIYKPKGKAPTLKVRLSEENVWLTQKQIGRLFGVKRPAITKHLTNIFKSDELEKNSVSSILEHTASDGKVYKTQFYSLDAIISIGYRVNSLQATHFRIWATNVLREYTVKGYALNKKRLKEREQALAEISQSIKTLQTVAETKKLSQDEIQGLIQVISDYAYGLKTLDDYDRQRLTVKDTEKKIKFKLDYQMARKSINAIKAHLKKSGMDIGFFGIEKDDSLKGSLKSIYQSINGEDAYSSIEEKAAHLLYFIIKNHPFTDGNKRIAASLFLWFLEENGCLYKKDCSRRIADNALVALTLMVAVSRPEDKDIMIKVIVNLINKNN